MARVNTIQDVVDRHLCMGCGTCSAARPDIVRMVDTVEHGRRPVIDSAADNATSKALARACPGKAIAASGTTPGSYADDYQAAAWGPVLEVWEGYATDPDIRFSGSSGGVVSALALHCIDHEGFEGAVQVRARQDQPILNETVISQSRDDILAASGSRYAPASPCERLADLRDSGEPHVFIGKPCDVSGASRLAENDERLSSGLGLSISIFCAGTPSVAATRALLDHLGVEPDDDVLGMRYRGRGWPGRMVARFRSARTGRVETASTSYEEGWGDILTKHTQWRCRMCADHLGEHADLSIGDPWYRPVSEDDPGQSLVVVRTERGRRILRQAMEAGILHLEQRSIDTLAASQPNLEQTRGAMFGRYLAARVAGVAWPRYEGAALHRVWWRALSPQAKLKSVAGTFKRLLVKRLWLRERAVQLEGRP